MIDLGKAAHYLRSEFGLSQRDAAAELGISFVHLCRIERGKVSPTSDMIDRFRRVWGVDLYMLAAGMFSDEQDIPAPLRAPLAKLTEAWRREVDRQIQKRRACDR